MREESSIHRWPRQLLRIKKTRTQRFGISFAFYLLVRHRPFLLRFYYEIQIFAHEAAESAYRAAESLCKPSVSESFRAEVKFPALRPLLGHAEFGLNCDEFCCEGL